MSIRGLLCIATLLVLSQATQLTLIVEHPYEKAGDVIEIAVGVKAKAELLKSALEIASVRVEEVQDAISKHCRATNSRKKCEDIVEQGGCEMEPLYKAVKGEPVFQGREG